MPIKHPAKERAWGSRYDTLKSFSSPPSNQTSPVASTTATPQSPIAIQTADVMPPNDDRPTNVGQSPVSSDLKSAKPSNDNSIFVGSLPTNIEPTELGYMLTQHLVDYPQIKDVKAVRDGKGSVCAFLACEDASAASQLLKNLQEFPPKLFHNRTLRFEFARASRALIISYRTPARLAYPNSGLEGPLESGALGINVSSDLPSAMRIFHPRNAKFPVVLYDDEAINFDASTVQTTATSSEDPSSSADVLSGPGVLFHPLKFDAETLKKLASLFGPLDFFGPFLPNKEGDASADPGRVLRPFMDIARSPRMEEGVWEVKWQRRDDSVLASMILRRVPHLQVIWTHHLNSDGGPDSRFASPSTSPGPLHLSMSRSRHFSRSAVNDFSYHRPQDQVTHFSPNMPPNAGNLRLITSPYSEGAVSPQFNHWSPPYSSRHMRGPSSPLVQRSSMEDSTPSGQSLDDSDFPPLHDAGRSRNITRPPSLQWISRSAQPADTTNADCKDGATQSPSPSSSLSVQPSTPGIARSTPSPTNESEDVLVSQPPSSPTVSNDVSDTDQGQELEVPMTPEFTASSITPVTPKTGTSYPLTPLSATMMESVPSFDNHHTTPRRGGRFGGFVPNKDEGDASREVDPCSVFVGNLELNAVPGWSEERLRGVFEKYGQLEEVSFHTPATKNVGFAFLRYADADSSLRAIAGEYEKIYDGRMIRVQIREVKPPGPRGTPYKGMRGRGRPRMYGDSPRHIPSLGGQDFHEQVHDEFSGYSPQSTHNRTPYRQEPRYANAGRDLPPHLSRGSNAVESTAPPQHPYARLSEHKDPSPPFDGHTQSWRPTTYPTDNVVERSTIRSSSTSASVSPPPSSHGSQPSSTIGYVPPYPMMMPWMHHYHPYPYPMPYMTAPYMAYPPMAPYPAVLQEGANVDAAALQQQAWDSQAQMYKRATIYPPTSDPAASSVYIGPGSSAEVQPPVRAVAFEHTSSGMFVPMYPPEALNHYMSTHSQVTPGGQTPPPQVPATQQQQQAAPPSVYVPQHPMSHMPMYPYPCAPQMTAAPSANQVAATPAGYYQPSGTGWTPGVTLSSSQAQLTPSPSHLQPVPSTYLAPSQTASAPLSSSASFSGHYAGTGSVQNDHNYGGPRGAVPPRRGMNRVQNYHGKNFNARASPNRFQRHGGDASMGASQSFVDGLSTAKSQQQLGPGGMRPYPTPYAGARASNGV